MQIDVTGLKPDPDNKGHVLGWGVIRRAPWHFAGIYPSEDAANAVAAELGADYVSDYGSYRVGSDDFIGGLDPRTVRQ
ncbi:hypothetical protein EXE55_14305 [Burkholderia glumae]|uniref:hypothetical protein n=1 Tax=Burkholderia glumae TaxID=337 RepID=UPI0013744A23|nr:hypothetical protein [Burkholderia glumae]QHP92015.1 hypothetical protein EXE55_14305 [Burkholderia glumae]